ncbi:copper chaperone PCu(A)C [Nakamurella leprariae]|uniref:Copper chaperone PCu(A)C n=1 Tax=Nakamurella leprariae TaxID=2803911 RepID=A0A938YB13_9ACTN|nr:copper chaperone PCu(A)C [Nakamurella leprariae]MBM9466296.1 copper chaperone PCu(A)C [Nakamurella leprariae]
MSSTARRPRRVLMSVAAAVVGVVGLSGCAAGMVSQTAQQVAAIDGANGQSGAIGILNVLLVTTERDAYPAGSDVELDFWVSNESLEDDTLVSVSSPLAESGGITGQARVTAQSLTDMATVTSPRVTLEGLTEDLTYGETVPVTFTFEAAGDITVNVPIAVPAQRSTDRPTVNILPPHGTPIWEEGHGEEGDHAEGGTESTGEASGH